MNIKTKDLNTKNIVLLQVLPHLNSGGLVSGAVEVSNAVTKYGGKSIVLSSGGYKENELKRNNCILEFLRVDSKNPFKIYFNKDKIIKVIKKYNVNIVHARSRAPAWSAYWAAKSVGLPFITTFHGTYGIESYFKKIYNSVMVKGDVVIAISNFIKDHINKNYGVNKPVQVIPRGVNINLFSPKKVTKARMISLANKLKTTEVDFIILMPGRLTEWKGQKHAIEAISKIKTTNFRLIIIGDKQRKKRYKDSLIRFAKLLNVDNYVQFVEHTRDLPAFMMLSDLILSCSTKPEAFGRIILEAQAMGRPVIAYNHGGAAELLKENQNGILSPVNSTEILAKNIDLVLGYNSSERKKISNKSISNVKKNYQTKFMTQKTIVLYKRILRKFKNNEKNINH